MLNKLLYIVYALFVIYTEYNKEDIYNICKYGKVDKNYGCVISLICIC